ncbi:MAG: hypothetical protein JWM50_1962 [Microbacteriaceae bacterium]|jgi:uncharacterized RDD family membrane protein YckC|nr:hypothetical protein [Microbacteriaceae bacterium]
MPRLPAIDQSSYSELDDEIVTGEAVALDLRPSSFVLRAAGALVDFVAYLGFYLVLVLLVIPILVDNFQLGDAVIAAVAVAMLVLAIVVAPIAVETLSHGKSLGKLVIGARIVRDDGGAIGFRHAFIRALLGVIEIFMSLGGIAVITSLLNERSKRLGDLVAGTFSQHERVSLTDKPVYGVPEQLAQWALTVDVARMPDRLSRRIAQFLAQAPRLTPETRHRLSRELAVEASPYVSPLPTIEAELFLAGVAAVRRERELTALRLEASGLERLAPVLGGLPNGFPDR